MAIYRNDSSNMKRVRNLKSLTGINSMYFNGTQYISTPHSDDFNTPSITIEYWYRPYHVTTRQHLICKWSTDHDMIIDFDDNRTSCLEWQLNRYESDNVYSTALTEGAEYHIVACCDTTTMYLYVNGSLVGSKTMNSSPRRINTNPLYIGRNNDNNYNLYADVFLVAIYKDTCWDAEIVASRYANRSQDAENKPANCVLFYDPRTIVGSFIPDLSGCGHNGYTFNIQSNIKRQRKISIPSGRRIEI